MPNFEFVSSIDPTQVVSPPFIRLMPIRLQTLSEAIAGLERTGVSLVSARGDSLFPTAAYIDDVGMYYFVPKIAVLLNLSPGAAWDLFFLSVLTSCAATGFILMLLQLSTRLSKTIFAISYLLLLITVCYFGDVYVLSPSLTVMFVPLSLILLRRDTSPKPKHWILFFLLGVAVATSHYIRSHSATGIALCFLVLLFFQTRWSPTQKLLSLGFFVIGIFSIISFFSMSLAKRDAFLSKLQPTYVRPPQSHPFWHTVYVGFGFLNNKYGIQYKDEVAHEKVRQLSPNAIPYSDEYECLLKNEVLMLFKTDLYFVARTLAAKAGVISFYLLIFSHIGLYCAMRYRLGWQTQLALLLGLSFHTLPGFIAIPHIPYLGGSFAFAVIYSALALDNALQKGFLKLWLRTPPSV